MWLLRNALRTSRIMTALRPRRLLSTPEPINTSSCIVNHDVVYVNAGACKNLELHTTWLRHNCQCPMCLDASTGQLLVDPATLRSATKVQAAYVDRDELRVVWDEQGHKSAYKLDWLADSQRSHALPRARLPGAQLQRCSFQDVMATDEGMLTWLEQLNTFGMSLVTGAPRDEKIVEQLASRISHPQPTIYGLTFDVRSEPNPINLAYSNVRLALHEDLAYYESPPGLQLLHCLDFSSCVKGGESTLVDGFALCEALRDRYPEEFHSLCTIPATFQKVHYRRKLPVHMTYTRPHIVVNSMQEITGFFWSPPFQAPLRNATPATSRAYYAGIEALTSLMPEFTLYYRLQPGEILTFNNRRALHGRESFESGDGGFRHLKGAYVNIDEFRSRLRVLQGQFGTYNPVHVGNQDAHAD